jgi:hypothetical protein
LLLSLTLVSGNLRAQLHLNVLPHELCATEIGHGNGDPSHHRHEGGRNACWCDCLGCVSAVDLTADFSSYLPVFFAGAVFYPEAGSFLVGHVLRPQPGPPRTGILS